LQWSAPEAVESRTAVEQPDATEPSIATASPDAVESSMATAVPEATDPSEAKAPPDVWLVWSPVSFAAAGPARKATMPTKPATTASSDFVARLFVVIFSSSGL